MQWLWRRALSRVLPSQAGGWAGSGSVDQLGRLPLRVSSIDKYAFLKKALTSVLQLSARPLPASRSGTRNLS